MNNEKIPCIPPLFHNGKFILDFKEKAELLMNSLQGSVLLLTTTANFPRFLLKKRASHFQQLNFEQMIS